MKKYILGIGSLAAAIAPVATVISCGDDAKVDVSGTNLANGLGDHKSYVTKIDAQNPAWYYTQGNGALITHRASIIEVRDGDKVDHIDWIHGAPVVKKLPIANVQKVTSGFIIGDESGLWYYKTPSIAFLVVSSKNAGTANFSNLTIEQINRLRSLIDSKDKGIKTKTIWPNPISGEAV